MWMLKTFTECLICKKMNVRVSTWQLIWVFQNIFWDLVGLFEGFTGWSSIFLRSLRWCWQSSSCNAPRSIAKWWIACWAKVQRSKFCKVETYAMAIDWHPQITNNKLWESQNVFHTPVGFSARCTTTAAFYCWLVTFGRGCENVKRCETRQNVTECLKEHETVYQFHSLGWKQQWSSSCSEGCKSGRPETGANFIWCCTEGAKFNNKQRILIFFFIFDICFSFV